MNKKEIIKLLKRITEDLEEIQSETDLNARKERNKFIRGMIKVALEMFDN